MHFLSLLVCFDDILYFFSRPYLDDEVFQQAVINSYQHIDLSGDNEKNISRVFAKMDRTAEWLRKKAAILAQEF